MQHKPKLHNRPEPQVNHNMLNCNNSCSCSSRWEVEEVEGSFPLHHPVLPDPHHLPTSRMGFWGKICEERIFLH